MNMTTFPILLMALICVQSPAAVAAERIRMIMDTDALAEVDDQHAIAYMLFSGDHFEVERITVNRGSDGGKSYHRKLGINDHFAEAVNVVKLCNAPHIPVLKGSAGNYQQLKGEIEKSTFDGSDAVDYIIQRAHAPSDRPLIIYACGNLTNVWLGGAQKQVLVYFERDRCPFVQKDESQCGGETPISGSMDSQ